MADLTPEQKLALIRENLQEIIDVEIIQDVLKTRDLKVYFGKHCLWNIAQQGNLQLTRLLVPGTATTGRPHCGYFVPALKSTCYHTIRIRAERSFEAN